MTLLDIVGISWYMLVHVTMLVFHVVMIFAWHGIVILESSKAMGVSFISCPDLSAAT